MYWALLFIHITAAIMGLGAAIVFPIIAKSAKTTSQAKFTLQLLKRLEPFPKAGSIALFVTGLIMGIMNPSLFTSGWYIASIVVYLLTQIIVAWLAPKKMKEQAALLENHFDEQLPPQYAAIGKKLGMMDGISHLALFVMIVLMVFKPF